MSSVLTTPSGDATANALQQVPTPILWLCYPALSQSWEQEMNLTSFLLEPEEKAQCP